MLQTTKATVLLLTNADDYHSLTVAEGLRRKGAETHVWYTEDFPLNQTASCWFSGGQMIWEVTGRCLDLGCSELTSVWLRRPEPPRLPPSIDPEDRDAAARECNLFLRGLYRAAGREALWVNSLECQARCNLKTEQLAAAVAKGLRIPRTLCSNDPNKIRGFVKSCAGRSIYKPFYPMNWRQPEGAAVLFTAAISEEDLPEDEILRLTPGIFQELVPKRHELRVTFIGDQVFGAKLRSQEVPEAHIDWRAGGSDVPMEPTRLPAPLTAACRALASEFGLVFGCFDLIVTPEGDYVFLEVNEMGAFLWIEEGIPEFHMLDAFCELLIQGTPSYRVHETAGITRLADVADAVGQQMIGR